MVAASSTEQGEVVAAGWGIGWNFDAKGGGWEYIASLIVASVVQGLLRGWRLSPSGTLAGCEFVSRLRRAKWLSVQTKLCYATLAV
jgi:hypothetical protein